MKALTTFLLAIACISATAGDSLKCIIKPADVPNEWIDMVHPCIRALENQVKTEIDAAMTYLAMGAHFSQDTVNRPGFAKFFFASASEEREHAIKVIEYLLMRGQLKNDVSKLLNFPVKPLTDETFSGIHALSKALKLEAEVTKSIRSIIKNCENDKFNDYHLVDYLTGDFLTEQYNGQRQLAGMVSTLGKMMDMHGPLGEFLYDKKILKEEL
ncbi:ferritin subunit-like [Chelonus insularis]|uniref:ferritin subunit-like n=1 Tax=Chelonus insularis TaxID=460826 RepID=UPI00158C1E80|nr:ferritin subunit-like [Chelonus insularis]